MRHSFLPFILLAIFMVQLAGQDIPDTLPSPEEEFEIMKSYAAEKHYPEAKALGKKILESLPAYDDVSLYMARIYGWESNYDSAYAVIDSVLARSPELMEAYEILVDLAYWENDWAKMEEYAARALELDPDSEAFQAKYLLAKNRPGSDREVAELFVLYTYDHFRFPYRRNWHMLTVGGNIPVKPGTLIPYVNGGYHPGLDNPSSDIQLNLDAYFHLGKRNYAMAGYGISPGGVVNFLPQHRAALEIWQVLPKGFGLSAGLRYFYWDRHFTFLTLSGEKYAGNYWFAFRSYLFYKEYGISGSYYLSARRYFENKYNHVTLTLGYGTAPDEPLLVVSDLDRLKALSARIEFSRQVSQNLRMSLMTGYAYEAYAEMLYRNRLDVRAGLYIRLKK